MQCADFAFAFYKDDHFEVKKLIEQWRKEQYELDELRKQYRHLKRNKQQLVDEATAAEYQQLQDVLKSREFLPFKKKLYFMHACLQIIAGK